VGRCPTPQQGRCPCTPQGPLALDPSPGNPEGFPGCSFLGLSYGFGLSLPGQPGGFPIAPWTPSVCILVSSLFRSRTIPHRLTAEPPLHKGAFVGLTTKFVPPTNRLMSLSSVGAPKVSKGRSESPLVAREGETSPCKTAQYERKIPLTKKSPKPFWAWGDGSRANGPCGGGGGGAPDRGPGAAPRVGAVGAKPPPRGPGAKPPGHRL